MSGRSRHHQHFRSLHRDGMALAQSEHTRFTRHEGNGGNLAAKTLQETLRLPRKLSWWERNFKWEYNLTVAGKTIEKGWVIPQQLGIALIILILGAVGTLYWTMSARIDAKDNAYQEQRDMLIEIKTELKIQKEHDAEWKRKQVDRDELQNLQIQDVKDRVLVLKN